MTIKLFKIADWKDLDILRFLGRIGGAELK